jgi:hypothetical protein
LAEAEQEAEAEEAKEAFARKAVAAAQLGSARSVAMAANAA